MSGAEAPAGPRPGVALGPQHPRTVVVGGGIAGAAVALALRERGAAATVVDRARTGRATAASAGMLTPLYEAKEESPLLRLGLRGLERWPDFAARLERLAGAAIHRQPDDLLVACADAAEERASARAAERLGELELDAELLEPRAARRLEPGLGEARAWLRLGGQGQVDAQAVAEALPPALRSAGVALRTGAAVTAVTRRGRAVSGVALEDGERIEAERVVVAAGAWSGELAGLPRRLPLRPVRGQMIRYHGVEGLPGHLVADHAGRYVVPRNRGNALAGSTMEEAGFDPATTPEGLEEIRSGAVRLVPSLEAASELERWAGLRPMAPDGAPILGPAPEVDGLLYATAYGRNGVLIAPAAGEAIAALALGDEPGFDLTPFRPDRFG